MHSLHKESIFIPSVGKVDGYCQMTNTVYEYHGDFGMAIRTNLSLMI